MNDRGEDPARDVAEVYSSGAAAYAEHWAPALRPLGEELIHARALAKAVRVLDAGTGVGAQLPTLRRDAPGATVIGVDAAPGMLSRADRTFPLAAMDLRLLGFRDGSFDAAVAAFVLFHVPEPDRALQELRRVLRKGGALGTLTWESGPDFPAQLAWNEELDRQGAPESPHFTDHAPFSSEAAVRDRLEAAGFRVLRAWSRPFGHAHEPETFLVLRTRLGGSSRRFRSIPPERRPALLEAVRRRFDALPPGAFVDRTRAIFAWARRV